MITIVDATAYTQTTQRYCKLIPIEDAIPKEPCLTNSRFEVLQQKIRKVYFDIDGIPDDNILLIYSFIDDYNAYIMSKGYVKEPIKFVYTSNSNSPNHPGVGGHIIAKSASMDATKQHTLLLGFLSEFPKANEYKPYVDTSVYSSRQLFRLPNYIGLPMVDKNNYHRMLDAEIPTDYIIQNITGCTYINPAIECKQEWRKAEKHISYIPKGKDSMVKALYEVIVNKRSNTYYDVHAYIDKCQELLLDERITKPLTDKLNDIISNLRERRNIETSIGLIDTINRKLSAK